MITQSGCVARLRVAGDELVVDLNLIEKLAALRGDVRVPLASVRHVWTTDRPWDSLIPKRVKMGFASSGAPGRTFVTVGPRATTENGKAMVVVYRNSRSVVVEVEPGATPWALLVVSSSDADVSAETLRRAARL